MPKLTFRLTGGADYKKFKAQEVLEKPLNSSKKLLFGKDQVLFVAKSTCETLVIITILFEIQEKHSSAKGRFLKKYS